MKEWPFWYYGAAGDLERARCPYWSLPTASGGNLLINSKSVGRSAVLEALASAGGGLLSTPGIQGPAKPQGLWLTSGLIGFSIQRRDDRPGRAQVHTVPLRVMRDSSFSYCFIMPAPGMPTGEPPPPGCTRPLGPPGLSSQRCPRAPPPAAGHLSQLPRMECPLVPGLVQPLSQVHLWLPPRWWHEEREAQHVQPISRGSRGTLLAGPVLLQTGCCWVSGLGLESSLLGSGYLAFWLTARCPEGALVSQAARIQFTPKEATFGTSPGKAPQGST